MAALGVAGLILAEFEMVMPIVGFLGGSLVGQALGSFADYAAAAVLVAAVIDGDPFAEPATRDWAVRDYRSHLQAVAKAAPATVNSALAAIDDFYDCVSGAPSAPLDEGTVVATSARAREDRSVNRPLLAATEIHGTATRVRVVAQGCIELGQYLLTSGRPRQRRVPPVVQELDQVSQDLLALASNLTRLATAIEEGRPPETNREGRFADPATPT